MKQLEAAEHGAARPKKLKVHASSPRIFCLFCSLLFVRFDGVMLLCFSDSTRSLMIPPAPTIHICAFTCTHSHTHTHTLIHTHAYAHSPRSDLCAHMLARALLHTSGSFGHEQHRTITALVSCRRSQRFENFVYCRSGMVRACSALIRSLVCL
jgi:hypothetical protein